MAVAFRAAAAQANTGGSTTITITKPAGTTNGDVLIAWLAAPTAAAATMTPPAGWTSLTGTAGVSGTGLLNGVRAWSFYKVAGTGEGASYEFTCSINTTLAGTISAFSGVDSGSPINDDGTASTSGTQPTTFDTPVVTTTRANCGIVNLAAGMVTVGNGPTFTWPASTTRDAQAQCTVFLADNPTAAGGHDNTNQASAGNTTARTITSNVGTPWVTSTIALTPAGNPPPVRMVRQAVKRSVNW